MKLAVSQIAWQPQEEDAALTILAQYQFAGLEVAPTRIAGENPYATPRVAADFAIMMADKYSLAVCSLQSIWFGQTGSLFGPAREALYAYTERAILFAEAAGAGNLVFGCPKNRVKPEGTGEESAVAFFAGLGAFAAQHGTVLALEANPPVYETNFMNTTAEALAMARRVDSPGCKVNLDVGTMVINGEEPAFLKGRIQEINHVHISEPGLAMIEERPLHKQLAALLKEEDYQGFISIEMKQQSQQNLQKAVAYVAEVFR